VSEAGKIAELMDRYSSGSAMMLDRAHLAMQSPEKQAIVSERLLVLDAYLTTENPSVADVDTAALKLGISRRQFYRLLTKFRSDGPVRGLLPGLQQVRRSSAARDGLADPFEAILIEELRSNPDIKIAQLARLLTDQAQKHGIEPPTEWKLRHRIHALRADGIVGDKANFGFAMLVDQITLNLPVRVAETAKYCAVTLILDRQTRIIAGAGVTVTDGFASGLAGALGDFLRRAPDFEEAGFPVASKLNELIWVAPPDLAEDEIARLRNEMSANPSVVEVIYRRQGDRVMRLVGDKLGIFNFRTRTELGIDVENVSDSGVDLEDAATAVGIAVDAWNKNLVLNLPKVKPDERPKHLKRLKRVLNQIQTAFAPTIANSGPEIS